MSKTAGRWFFDMLKSLQLGKSELEIYHALVSRPMTIKDLKKSTSLSERMLRSSIDALLEKNFIKRKAMTGKRLKYVYYSNQPKNVVDFLKNVVQQAEKRRLKSREEILKWSDMKY